MFNPLIETAIGLVFVYLLLSMICSAIQEWIAAMLGLRAKTLEQGLINMLGSDCGIVNLIYAHPLVKGLSRSTWWNKLTRSRPRPSYISATVFAQAFLSAAGVTAGQDPALPVTPLGASTLAPETQKLLQTLINYAPGDITQLRSNLENWYDDAMARVSGWYTRKVHTIILLIALLLSFAINADTFMIATALWHDPTVRAATADAATQYVREHQTPAGSGSSATATQNLAATIGGVQQQLGSLGLPLGWCFKEGHCFTGQRWQDSPWIKVLGILLTTIAISQGAPFWFDLLQKVTNIRLTGDAPGEGKEESSR